MCLVYIFRLLIKNGNNIDSPPVYDSYEVEYLPNEGVLSTGRYLFIEFTTDGTLTSTGAAIRYEGRRKKIKIKEEHFDSYSTGYLKPIPFACFAQSFCQRHVLRTLREVWELQQLRLHLQRRGGG